MRQNGDPGEVEAQSAHTKTLARILRQGVAISVCGLSLLLEFLVLCNQFSLPHEIQLLEYPKS